MSAPDTASSARFAWRILKADPWTWGISLALWVAFFTMPLPAGLVLRAILDQLPDGDGAPLPLLLAILAGFEIGRWIILFPAIVQWHGSWVFWHTVPRVNALRSLVSDPGPATGRLPGSPGEAVSRFRDDARDIAQVLDVWLDLVAAGLTTVAGVIVLFLISPTAAAAIVAPIIVVLAIGHLLAARLRAWRWAEREATAGVTGFIGDAFGAIATVKVSAAEGAILHRFDQLGATRAEAARADQVGTQLAQTLGGITANAGLGLALVLIAPAMSRGELSIGDIGLFTAYATAVSSLPRITARWSTFQRQGDVSAARLGRLMPEHDPDLASTKVTTHLRSGPPPFAPVTPTAPGERTGDQHLDELRVRGLRVHLDDTDQLHGVDLDVRRGQFVVITGPVGSGKSVLLRALLGLVPRSAGTIWWNGEEVDDPAAFLVPPRTAYLPRTTCPAFTARGTTRRLPPRRPPRPRDERQLKEQPDEPRAVGAQTRRRPTGAPLVDVAGEHRHEEGGDRGADAPSLPGQRHEPDTEQHLRHPGCHDDGVRVGAQHPRGRPDHLDHQIGRGHSLGRRGAYAEPGPLTCQSSSVRPKQQACYRESRQRRLPACR